MHESARDFFDIYAHNFVRVGVAVPRVSLADPAENAAEIGGLFAESSDNGVALTVFPELSLSGYSLDDLHQQDALLQAVREGLDSLRLLTARHAGVLVVGAPLRLQQRLFNCALALANGKILGIAPKRYVPNYREFYEKRQFASAQDLTADTVELLGQPAPIGTDLVFQCREIEDFAFHMEICEDVWVPIPPSTYAALRGATVLVNLSASNVTIGKHGYRHQLAAGQSAKMLAAYLYSAAGSGESSTDLAWDGHGIIYENGELLGETERFCENSQVLDADIDLDRLVQERSRFTSFIDCATEHKDRVASQRLIPLSYVPAGARHRLRRAVGRLPFVPAEAQRRDERCFEAYSIQVGGLLQRLRSAGIDKIVIGVSGGLDSTHALIVACRAMDKLGLPRQNVLAYTMPAYATSSHTLENAHRLMKAMGVSAAEIDIRASCEQMFKDLDHPHTRGEKVYDITFENVQAGERTSHLFRLANLHGAMVLGTGDLSELALGWCTYGVGDHMSHYNVNASLPKTLIRYLIEWEADRPEVGEEGGAVLRRILETEISPELIPGDDNSRPGQSTESTIGPYALHDFSLYYISRRGYRPAKVAFLACNAWAEDNGGGQEANTYSVDEILEWLGVFLDRFFRTSQFKRSVAPNGPKVGSGGSLSPRGDWRAPSDNRATPWLAELDAVKGWLERGQGQ